MAKFKITRAMKKHPGWLPLAIILVAVAASFGVTRLAPSVTSGLVTPKIGSFNGYAADPTGGDNVPFDGSAWHYSDPATGQRFTGSVMFAQPYWHKNATGEYWDDLPTLQAGNVSYYRRLYHQVLPLSVYTTDLYTNILGTGVASSTIGHTVLSGTKTSYRDMYWDFGYLRTGTPEYAALNVIHGYLPNLYGVTGSGNNDWTTKLAQHLITGGFVVDLAADTTFTNAPLTITYDDGTGTFVGHQAGITAGIVSATAINSSVMGQLDDVGKINVQNVGAGSANVVQSANTAGSTSSSGTETTPGSPSTTDAGRMARTYQPITDLHTWLATQLHSAQNGFSSPFDIILSNTQTSSQGGLTGGMTAGQALTPFITGNAGWAVPAINNTDPLSVLGNYTQVSIHVPLVLQPQMSVVTNFYTFYQDINEDIIRYYSTDPYCKYDYWSSSASTAVGTLTTNYPTTIAVGVTQSYVTYYLDLGILITYACNWTDFTPYQSNSGTGFDASKIPLAMPTQDWGGWVTGSGQEGSGSASSPTTGGGVGLLSGALAWLWWALIAAGAVILVGGIIARSAKWVIIGILVLVATLVVALVIAPLFNF